MLPGERLNKGALLGEKQQQNEPPPPDEERRTPGQRGFDNGLKWGFVGGCAIAQVIVLGDQIETPMGHFYPGNALLVFIVCCGAGMVFGAVTGWLSAQNWLRDDISPPPDLPMQ